VEPALLLFFFFFQKGLLTSKSVLQESRTNGSLRERVELKVQFDTLFGDCIHPKELWMLPGKTERFYEVQSS
jgi:hypothetical protein